MYEQIKTKENYDKLLKNGMFWEFHPELTGNWENDKIVILNITTDPLLATVNYSRQQVIEIIYNVLKATGKEIGAEMRNIHTGNPFISYNGDDLDNWIERNV